MEWQAGKVLAKCRNISLSCVMPKEVLMEYVMIIGALIYTLLALLLPEAIIGLTIRPIPYEVINTLDEEGNRIKTTLKDFTLMNSYIKDSDVTFSGVWLIIIGFFLPLAIIVGLTALVQPGISGDEMGSDDDIDAVLPSTSSSSVSSLLLTSKRRRRTRSNKWSDTRIACSAFLFACATTLLVTDTVKVYVGRLRPNFYSMCAFDDDSLECTADVSQQHEARKSFPSGHSSISMNGMLFVSLYIVYNSPLKSPFAKYFFFLAPVALAVFVAASRVHDNWHHPSDVLCGALIGGFSAAGCFVNFYLA